MVDGIGGLADAAATAQVVAERLPLRVCEGVAALHTPGVARAVTSAAAEINACVRTTARSGPGTTGASAALVLVRDGLALVAHLGDSRVYLARGGRLRRLTEDHSRDGQLTRYVGMPGEVVPEVSVHELSAGDRILLCTDGLTGSVDDRVLGALLGSASDPEDACALLVEAATSRGAIDDISVITLECSGADHDGTAVRR